MNGLFLFCADIGSVAAGRFGWACFDVTSGFLTSGTAIDELASRVAERLDSGAPVALGFECPLYVPLVEEVSRLTSARRGEGNRAWCAGAGAGALATGLAEVPWLLRAIRGRIKTPRAAYVRWSEFVQRGEGLFLWEAFVTAAAKRDSHVNDAVAAVEAFKASLPNADGAHALGDGEVMSLLGAAMLRTGWTEDLMVLTVPVLVIRG
jgi:hypothetical protein